MADNAGDLRLPSLDGLRAVDAAARLGSFERAAEGLAITASAVAKRVAAVEDLLGTPLFVRNGRALQPTPACLDYLPPVRAALALLAQMPQHQRPHARARRLRISAPPTFARLVLVPALEDFSRAHPGIDIEVVLSIPFLDNPAHSAPQADGEIPVAAVLQQLNTCSGRTRAPHAALAPSSRGLPHVPAC